LERVRKKANREKHLAFDFGLTAAMAKTAWLDSALGAHLKSDRLGKALTHSSSGLMGCK
jgi:hypothetical protein